MQLPKRNLVLQVLYIVSVLGMVLFLIWEAWMPLAYASVNGLDSTSVSVAMVSEETQ